MTSFTEANLDYIERIARAAMVRAPDASGTDAFDNSEVIELVEEIRRLSAALERRRFMEDR